MEAVAAGDEIARQPLRVAVRIAKPDRGLRGVEALDRDVARFEQDRSAGREARGDHVLDHLVLAVDHDRLAGEVGEVDVVAPAVEAQVDPAVNEPFAHHALAQARGVQEIDATVFEHARANAALAVRSRARLDDDRFDAGAMEQVRKHETGRAGPDDSNLSVHAG